VGVIARVDARPLSPIPDGKIGMFPIEMPKKSEKATMNQDPQKSNVVGSCTPLTLVMPGSFYGLGSLISLAKNSRRGKAVRLSYDHKGTDEAEGRRIAAAGGLILNSRVNGTIFSQISTNSRCSCGHPSPRGYLYEGVHLRASIHYRDNSIQLF